MLGALGGQVNESDSPADLHRRANLQPAPLRALPDFLDGDVIIGVLYSG